MTEPDGIVRRNARFARYEASSQEGFLPGQKWLFSYDAEKAVWVTTPNGGYELVSC